MDSKAKSAIGAALNFSGEVREDLGTDDIASMPLFVYLRGGDPVGLNPEAAARDCFRLGRIMVSWAVESREAGGAHAVGIARLNLARRFRQAGRAWRLRAQGVGA